MLAVLDYREIDYIPCSFMIFENLFNRCETQEEYIDRELALGMDAVVNVGKLNHALHPDVDCTVKSIDEEGERYFIRIFNTPKGTLHQKVMQKNKWPSGRNFPIFDDWLIPRTAKALVDPEKDLEKVRYLLGPFKKEDIGELREAAKSAGSIARKHDLLQVAGLIGWGNNGIGWWTYQIACMDMLPWLSGFEPVMVLSLTRPEIIEEYVRIVSDWNMRQIEIYLEHTDADLIVRRGWYETTEFWTPYTYARFIAPTIKREARLVHQAGRMYGYIITSAFMPIIDHILGSGIDVLIGLDPVQGKGTDPAAVKKMFYQRKKALWGGISGAVTVEMGTEEETERAVRNALEIMSPGGGFILSPVDNVQEDTPRAWNNTHTLIHTWKKYRDTFI
jgi:hypothetical protein